MLKLIIWENFNLLKKLKNKKKNYKWKNKVVIQKTPKNKMTIKKITKNKMNRIY